MVTKIGGQILATKFGFVPDWEGYSQDIFVQLLLLTLKHRETHGW